jgi:hypothetical protein
MRHTQAGMTLYYAEAIPKSMVEEVDKRLGGKIKPVEPRFRSFNNYRLRFKMMRPGPVEPAGLGLEARGGIEPPNKGFADLYPPGVTTAESTSGRAETSLGANSGQVPPLKCLSVLQPWPWLMFHGVPLKDIENRTWPLPRSMRGQRVVIHASARRSMAQFDAAADLVVSRLLSNHIPTRGIPSFAELPFSAIIGTVEIVDCVTASDSPWFAGPYGFVLRDPRPLAEPIPCRGRLGFWTVPEAIAREVRAQERRAA